MKVAGSEFPMKKFLADLFAGRLSLEANMALGALSVIGIFLPLGGYVSPVCGVLFVLSSLGALFVPVAIWRCAIKLRDRPGDQIGAMGCAIMLFVIGLISLTLTLLFVQSVVMQH
jgi:hypothetical protein